MGNVKNVKVEKCFLDRYSKVYIYFFSWVLFYAFTYTTASSIMEAGQRPRGLTSWVTGLRSPYVVRWKTRLLTTSQASDSIADKLHIGSRASGQWLMALASGRTRMEPSQRGNIYTMSQCLYNNGFKVATFITRAIPRGINHCDTMINVVWESPMCHIWNGRKVFSPVPR